MNGFQDEYLLLREQNSRIFRNDSIPRRAHKSKGSSRLSCQHPLHSEGGLRVIVRENRAEATDRGRPIFLLLIHLKALSNQIRSLQFVALRTALFRNLTTPLVLDSRD